MTKKLVSAVLSVIIILSVIFTGSYAFADSNAVEGVFINKPDVTFLLDGSKESNNVNNIKLNDEALEVNSISNYKIKEQSVIAYVIIDVSGSVSSDDALNVFKKELISFAKTFGNDDSFVLYTMGDEAKEILSGGESASAVESAINSIKRTNQNSYIYHTLNLVYDKAIKNTDYDRSLILIVSDGVNFSNKTSYDKIYNKYKSHALPIYSLLYSNGEISSDRKYISEFTDLVSDSGGATVEYNENNGNKSLSKLIKEINDKTIVKCSAKNNNVDKSINNNILSFDNNNKSLEIKNIYVSTNNSDNVAPEITKIEYDKVKGNFVITFTEDIVVDDSNVSVSKKDKNIKISNVTVKGNALTIKPKEEIYSGKYSFDLSGVTDLSNEKNHLDNNIITEKISATNIVVKVIKDFWWMLIVVALLIAILLILLFVKKKKNVKNIKEIFETQIEEENIELKHTQVVKKQFYSSPDYSNKKLSLIVEYKGNRNKIELNVLSSVIVGRSSDCDICVEDTKLSRQHFAIEVVNNNFIISDLNTTNGTFVNGTKVSSRRLLSSGDKIIAGSSMFIVL